MALADSLLSAIVRADGDALVMHVGERPYVVVGTQTINISTHGLHLETMTGMLSQLLPADAQGQLEEFGAVEYKIPFASDDRFSIVAARGGDDIWIEIRRRRGQPAVVAPPTPEPKPVVTAIPAAEPASVVAATPAAEPASVIAPRVPEPELVVAAPAPEPEPVVAPPAPEPAPAVAAAPEPAPAPIPFAAPEPVTPVETPQAVVVEPPPPLVAAEAPILEAEPASIIAAPAIVNAQSEPVRVAVEQQADPAIPAAALEPQPEPIPAVEHARPLAMAEPTPEPVPPAPELAAPPAVPEQPAPISEIPEPIAAPVVVERVSHVEPAVPAPIAQPVAEVAPAPSLTEPLTTIDLPPTPTVEHAASQAAAEPMPVAVPEPAPAAIPEPPPLAISEPTPTAIPEPTPTAVQEPTAIPEPVPAIEAPQTEMAPVAPAADVEEPLVASAGEATLELLDDDDGAYADEGEDEDEDEGEEIDIDLEPAAAAVPLPVPIPESFSQPPSIGATSIESRSEPEGVSIAASVERQPESGPAQIAASIQREAEPVPIAPVAPMPPVAPAPVLPLTRTVRIEVPPRAPAAVSTRSSSDIERLLRVAVARGAASLFITSESRPWLRIEGDLRQMDSEPPVPRADVERAILEIAPESSLESIGKGEATEWISEFDEIGRVRCTTFNDHRGPGVLLRLIATRAATAEQLGLSRDIQALATESEGLVLVAGPRSSGKSTLMSALVDVVNTQRAAFVITLERQLRLVHDNQLALISQREVRGGAEESVTAARAALRENPDVLVVDDLVSPHMVPLLLTAASEGLLVFVSLAASSTAEAAARFIELSPPEMRKAVQGSMAETFRGAVGQLLLKKSGGGLVPAREVMLATGPVARTIGEGQLEQLPAVFESSRQHGMVSFTDALVEFVRAGTVDIREAFRKAPDRNGLLERLRSAGVDTTMVERLA